MMLWTYIYLHFRGFCRVTAATFISIWFQNRTYAERSTVLPRFVQAFASEQNLPAWNSKLSPKIAVLFCVSHPGRQASLVAREYYCSHKAKDNKLCLIYIMVSRERQQQETRNYYTQIVFPIFFRKRAVESLCQFAISASYMGYKHTIQIKHFCNIRFCFPYK